MTVAENSKQWTIKGWHVLACILVFFGIIFAVNGIFLVAALETHTGLVSVQPYRKGLDYNQRIAAHDEQRRSGWKHRLQLDAKAGLVRLTFTDRHERAVSGLRLAGMIGRPSTAQHDRSIVLAETSSAGVYAAQLDALPAGNWLIQIEASKQTPEGPRIVYRLKERAWLKH